MYSLITCTTNPFLRDPRERWSEVCPSALEHEGTEQIKSMNSNLIALIQKPRAVVWHAYSPVWVRACLVKALAEAKLLPQVTHT